MLLLFCPGYTGVNQFIRQPYVYVSPLIRTGTHLYARAELRCSTASYRVSENDVWCGCEKSENMRKMVCRACENVFSACFRGEQKGQTRALRRPHGARTVPSIYSVMGRITPDILHFLHRASNSPVTRMIFLLSPPWYTGVHIM